MNQTAMLLDMLAEGNVLVVSFKAPQINDTDFLEELEDSLRDLLRLSLRLVLRFGGLRPGVCLLGERWHKREAQPQDAN